MRTTLDDRMKEKMALEEERDYVKETVGKLQGQLSQIQAEVTLTPSFLHYTINLYGSCHIRLTKLDLLAVGLSRRLLRKKLLN